MSDLLLRKSERKPFINNCQYGEMANTRDLKSLSHNDFVGSSPTIGTPFLTLYGINS